MENPVLDPAAPHTVPSIELNPESLSYLKETAKWARFLAILGFIGMGLMVIIGLLMGTIMSSVLANSPAQSVVPGKLLAVIYIVLAAIYFFPCLYLFRFGTKAKQAIETKDTDVITESMGNLKSLFKFMGICAIVILSIYAVIFVGAILVFMMR